MDLDEFNALFEGFERTAFRVEARDRYDVADERQEFAAFLSGEDLPRRTPENDPWLARVAKARASGRTVERVRVVAQPLTDYTRFELAGYPDNVAAGEKVWIVARSELSEADQAWANEDFWIFDDETVVLIQYDDQDRFLGVERVEEPGRYLTAKRRALDLAVKLEAFVGRPCASGREANRGAAG